MAERTTKEVTAPRGHKVVLKEYLTAREMLPILKSVSTAPTAEENIDKALKMMEVAIVSLDGSKENLVEMIQDLPLEDYIFIQKEVAALADFRSTKGSTGTSSSS